MSVHWFRSLHPEPVVLRPEGPTADSRIAIAAWTFRIARKVDRLASPDRDVP